MANHKWADVCHYYQGIDVIDPDFPEVTWYGARFSIDGGCYAKQPRPIGRIEHETYHVVGSYKPLLRHLNDITAEEIKELHCAFFEYEHTDYAGNKIRARSADIREHEGLLAATRIVKGYTFKRAVTLNYYPSDGRSGEISETFSGLERGIWLIKRGFDMFGLIESGQATRKEKEQGGGKLPPKA